jgi:hypothetical protein
MLLFPQGLVGIGDRFKTLLFRRQALVKTVDVANVIKAEERTL